MLTEFRLCLCSNVFRAIRDKVDPGGGQEQTAATGLMETQGCPGFLVLSAHLELLYVSKSGYFYL